MKSVFIAIAATAVLATNAYARGDSRAHQDTRASAETHASTEIRTSADTRASTDIRASTETRASTDAHASTNTRASSNTRARTNTRASAQSRWHGYGQPDKAAIKDLQTRLNALGYAAGEVDGIMGPRTRAAMREYRRDQGFAATGDFSAEAIAGLGMDESAAIGVTGALGAGGQIGSR